ncbi:peptidase S8 and S53 subtilisin kexin sedolisin [Candidatus Nitrosarchaeum limnium SFB1]|uniref:Peptidase S8 and S53 subtilisin kexin sedolisin n=1 Tax=Candidatus Nitrosarchaeum limnium SFB1 TaxID=886738 RepID=F3KMF8_9ARCH|nr:peptidase S8 and S53 subtilisin kexin sedolisin [Candidatus Nitrosarchaeum limnium SFB1]
MKLLLVFTFVITVLTSLIILEFEPEDVFHTYLDKSVPFIGGDVPKLEGIDGAGIKVAVIDTGVDYNHPDLFGWGQDGKVIGGYNFIEEGKPPLDTNGHGTQVAGVIAADGDLKGVSPKAKILAYKVSENGEAVSSDLIIKAIDKSIEDGADVINISLGVNKTNGSIDHAVDKALAKNVFVVTAAGNDGPLPHTIGSPGRNEESITVGATYNNLTSSLVATLEVNEKSYTVIPMVGSSKLDEPIVGKIIFGKYGKQEDLKDINATGAILIVERGSDNKDDRLYFSLKEKNAVNAGAKALIVYNNEPGIFLGELIHDFIEPGYVPQIPVVSIDRDDGLEIIEKIKEKNNAVIHLFYNPDFVAHFSSRGPVSPFYIKPDIVAPGAYINTTQRNGGYNFTSGTSFAAPHVSGAVALLIEKYPSIGNQEIKSLLMTTSEPVSDAYGHTFSFSDAGAGRIDIAKAFHAKLIITPPSFVISLSSDNPVSQNKLKIKLLNGTLDGLEVKFDGPQFIQFDNSLKDNDISFKIKILGQEYGDHETRIIINHDGTRYVIPVLIHYTEGSISVNQKDGKLKFVVYQPENWEFAKISVINSKTGKTEITSAIPGRDSSIEVDENAKYWIDAKIRVSGKTFDAYNTIDVNTVNQNSFSLFDLDIPQRQVAIVLGIIMTIGAVGVITMRRVTTRV